MNVIIICHEIPLWGLDNKGERTQTGVTFDAWPKLDYDLDLALNIQKTGPRRFAKVSKSRLEGFEEATTFDWSYENFALRYGKEVIERDTVRLILASEEQLAEAIKLIGIVKLDEANKQDKWILENYSVLAEVEAEKVSKIISYLKQKVTV